MWINAVLLSFVLEIVYLLFVSFFNVIIDWYHTCGTQKVYSFVSVHLHVFCAICQHKIYFVYNLSHVFLMLN